MKSRASILALTGLATLGMTVAACSGGDSEPPATGESPRPDVVWPGSNPTPTTTPTGPIWLDQIASDDGTNVTSLGECVGFTIVTDTYTFGPDATATLGPLGSVPVTYLDAQRLRVGAPANDYTCVWTSPFAVPGAWDLEITSGGETWTVAGAIDMKPLKAFDAGYVGPSRVWTVDLLAEPGANEFERPYDVDIYVANFGDPPYTVYDHMELFPTGSTAVIPDMEFWDPDSPDSYLNHGGYGLIFPMRGINYIVVKDRYGMGGPGATYDLSFIGKSLSGTSPSDTCEGAPLIDASKGYHADYDSLTNVYDPQNSPGCRDSVYGTYIKAPGNDGVWRVQVPPGKELRVSSYDNHIDNVMLLLPSAGGCAPKPTNCVAAAGRFGGGNTDTLIYRNTSTAMEEFFLIHDSATVMSSGVGSFLINVEVFDPR